MFSRLRKALATVSKLPATVSVGLIRLYQLTLSPDHGLMRHLYPHGFCRHHPTCSMYAIDVFRTRSYPVAIWLAVKRLLSCHPWKQPTDEKLLKVIQGELRM
jgi:hypothetical protein